MGTNSNLVIIDGDKRALEHASYDGYISRVLPSILASVASYGLDAIRSAFKQAKVVPLLNEEECDDEDVSDRRARLTIDAALLAAEATGKSAYGLDQFLKPGDRWNCKHPYIGLAAVLAPEQTYDTAWGDGDVVVDLAAGTVFFPFDFSVEGQETRGLRLSLAAGWDAWDPEALAQVLTAKIDSINENLYDQAQPMLDIWSAEIEALAVHPQAFVKPSAPDRPAASPLVDTPRASTLDIVVFKLPDLLALRALEAGLRQAVCAGRLPATCLSDDVDTSLTSRTDQTVLSSIVPDSDGWWKVVVRVPSDYNITGFASPFSDWADQLAGLGAVVETHGASGGVSVRHSGGAFSCSGWSGSTEDLDDDDDEGHFGMNGPRPPRSSELAEMMPVRSETAQKKFWEEQLSAVGSDVKKEFSLMATMLVQALVAPSSAAFAALPKTSTDRLLNGDCPDADDVLQLMHDAVDLAAAMGVKPVDYKSISEEPLFAWITQSASPRIRIMLGLPARKSAFSSG